MELRACEYCQTDFQPKRKDHRYCRDACRSKAYLDRKMLSLSESKAIAQAYQPQVAIMPEPTEEYTRIKKADYDRLVNRLISASSGGTQGAYQGLLNEKDKIADLKAKISQYEMKLFYLEEKLKEKDTLISDLKVEISSYEKKQTELEKTVTQQDMGFISKLVENNPEIIPQCLDKLSPLLEAMKNKNSITQINPIESSIGNVADNSTIQNPNIMSKENLKPSKPEADYTDTEAQDMAEVIKDQLDKLSRLYPDHRVDSVLALIVDAVEKNKTMIDSFIFK